MLKWVKFAAVLLLALAVIVGGGGVWWVRQNRARFRGTLNEAREAGLRFGEANPDSACIDEALRRLEERGDFIDEIASHQPFLESCLKVAARTSGFCEPVPPPGELVRWLEWSCEACAERGHDNQGCPRLMKEAQRVCYPER
jgi:hypothetical protein